MPASFCIGEFHGPPHVGNITIDLAVDEVADVPKPKEKRGGYHHLICHAEKTLPVPATENSCSNGGADENAVGRHTSTPVAQHILWVCEVVATFIDKDLKQSPEDKDAACKK